MTVMDILEHYPKPVLDVLMNSLSTHDVERALTALAGQPVGGNGREWQGQNNTLSRDRYELGKKLLRLAAVIQYALPGIPCLYYGDEAGLYGYKDPFNRSCYPWGREDADLIETFRQLGRVRRDYPSLSAGGFCPVSFTASVVSFIRDCGEESLYIAVNRTDQPAKTVVPAEFRGAVPLFGALAKGDLLAPYNAVILAAR